MVNRVWIILILLVLFGTAGCQKKQDAPPKPETWLKLSFLGFKEAFANTNYTFLQGIATKPSSIRLAEQTRVRLAVSAAAGLGLNPGAGEKVKEVLRDLTEFRSWIEVAALPGSSPEWLIAAAVPDDRSALWRGTLAAALARSTNTTSLKMGTNVVATESFSAPGGAQIVFVRARGWTLISSGEAGGGLMPAALQTLEATGRLGDLPVGAALKAESKLSAANAKLGWIPVKTLPKVEVVVSARNQRLRSEERWVFDSPVLGKLNSWNVPKETIHDDPLISFTAGRSLGGILREVPLFQTLQLGEALDEFYFWCQASKPPIMEYAAFRTQDASNSVEKIAAKVPELMERYMTNRSSGEVRWATNRSGLVWEGGPVVLPFVRALAEPAGQFVVSGLWPIMPTKTSIPNELVSQFAASTNVVYYHWESTPERLLHARPVAQVMGYLLSPYVSARTNALADVWLDEVAPVLEKTVIEATAVNDREIRVVRSSKLGLGAEGLVRLSHWVEHRDFPRTPPRFIFDPAPSQHRKSSAAPSSVPPIPVPPQAPKS